MAPNKGLCEYSGTLKDCYNRLEIKRPQPWVTYNSNLKCPELSPWLQKVDCLKKTNRTRPVPGSVPKNYQILKKNRFINKYKYCQPLTPSFRYYDETECYIEEYRLYKSPTALSCRLDLEREYNYLTAVTIEKSSSSGSNKSSSPKLKKKSKEYRSRSSVKGDEDVYLNNAKVTNAPTNKRVAIKIPKCETKHRRTFFPVILSRYNTEITVANMRESLVQIERSKSFIIQSGMNDLSTTEPERMA
ncbi:uncharacterized protein LOC134820368 isoform X2 [Bolinopsis microptera]|uniref:uncharacterized protein LOC134820368 isoform X2 n=1 Tax=Bolinopsis microptera TaxID=2820187 RepID=UPI003078E7AA